MFSKMILEGYGIGRTSAIDEGTLLPELEAITLESAADINTDPMEYSIRAMYEMQLNFQNIDTASVIQEYAYLKENGMEMVDEAASETIKAWFAKVIKAITGFAAKVAAFFKNAMNALDDRMHSDAGFIKSREADLKAMGNVTLAKPVTAYAFDNANPAAIESIYGKIVGAVKLVETAASHDEAGYIAKGSKEFNNTIIAACGDPNATSASQYDAWLISYIRGAENQYTTVTGTDVIASLVKADADRKNIKAQFESSKKTINASLKVVKDLEKECDKKSDKLATAKMCVTAINTALSILSTANRRCVAAIDAKRSLNRKLANAALAQSKKATSTAEKEKKKAENAAKKAVNASAIIDNLELQ